MCSTVSISSLPLLRRYTPAVQWRGLGLALAFILIGAISFGLLVVGVGTKNPIAIASSSLGWLLLGAQTIYRYSERAYLVVERARLFFTRSGATWSARADFDFAGSFVEALAVAREVLLKADNHSEQLSRDERTVVLVSRGMTVKLSVHAGSPQPNGQESSRVLVVDFRSEETTFRRAVEKATTTVPELMEAVRGAVKPDDEKYTAEIRFPAGNPYMGFFLTKLPMSNIDRFIVEFDAPSGRDDQPARVSAQKEKLTIVARSITSLSTASKRYLSLSQTRAVPAR